VPDASASKANGAIAAGAPGERPRLLVVIHTEEEFDWSAGFDRRNVGVSHVASIGRVQDIFERLGVTPTYVVDFPIASNEESAGVFRGYAESGRAVIGAHLHPWVSPPFEEEVTVFNSYPGNLPAALEEAKLRALAEAIRSSIGVTPKVYLAGRYGYGPNTFAILRKLGFEIDLSPVASYSFTSDGGPDFRDCGCDPFWEGPPGELLRIPHSGGYIGFLARQGRTGFDPPESETLRSLRVPGILWRCGALRHVRLTPEGYALDDMKRLTRGIFAAGTRVFHFSFHSPSVQPGLTPYVRSPEDLDRLLATIRGYLEFFAGEMNGIFVTPDDIRRLAAGAGVSAAQPATA
jgi:hypothetical protein